MLPFELTKDTLYLALSGELWSVFYEYFTEIDRVIKGFYCIKADGHVIVHPTVYVGCNFLSPQVISVSNKTRLIQ